MSTTKWQEATKSAIRFLKDAFAEKEISDVLLEEVELSDDGARWLITLGFNRLVEMPNEFLPFSAPSKLRREFKTIVIDAGTGEAIGMKMKGSSPVEE